MSTSFPDTSKWQIMKLFLKQFIGQGHLLQDRFDPFTGSSVVIAVIGVTKTRSEFGNDKGTGPLDATKNVGTRARDINDVRSPDSAALPISDVDHTGNRKGRGFRQAA